jgi:quinoprotein glucose dehydrogenase
MGLSLLLDCGSFQKNKISMKSIFINTFIFIIFILISSCKSDDEAKHKTWSVYNGSKEGIKYSSLNQIDTSNVHLLKPVWTYHTGDADTINFSQIQTNPIVIDSILYGVSAQMKLFAINAKTGVKKWVFDPLKYIDHSNNKYLFHIMINSRGISYWSDGAKDSRIFFTAGSHLYAIDAVTGVPIKTFGHDGSIDLHDGLDRDGVEDQFVVNNSPTIVYKDMVITGSRVDETMPAAPGHIRAYDVKTGLRKWIFHTIPHPSEYGYDTWEDKNAYKYFGGVNCWSGFTLDENKGILFVPLGTASSDFYGGKRKGNTLYANCLLALDANTGKHIWHYQTIHHDMWDKDLPTPPVLITLNKDGKKIEALAQITKNGYVYVFERATGKPIYDIKEIPVDTTNHLPGEKPSPTQPYPTVIEPFARQTITAHDINPYISKEEQAELRAKLSTYKFGNPFIPPSLGTSIILPGYDGGGEWAGPAYDPQTNRLYVNSNEMAWLMKMVPNPMQKNIWSKNETYPTAGEKIFIKNCSACHGKDRKGTGNSPSLLTIHKKYDAKTLIGFINTGRRMMPSFNRLPQEEKYALAAYLLNLQDQKNKPYTHISTIDSTTHMPYKIEGYTKFLTKEGLPAISPPWGTLSSINLATGKYDWKIPFGSYPDLEAKGIKNTGSENYGGPVVTDGGLVFIGATKDNKFRAYHKATGKLLWEYTLPASAFATPAIYEIDGKQYVVIACGGGKLKMKSGDSYLAFAL